MQYTTYFYMNNAGWKPEEQCLIIVNGINMFKAPNTYPYACDEEHNWFFLHKKYNRQKQLISLIWLSVKQHISYLISKHDKGVNNYK